MSGLLLLHPASIGMGLHVASVRVRRAMRGHRRYPGSAEDILRAGLEECWSGRYLTASPGTYKQFWTRDTGFAAPSLIRLGGPWPGRLLSTLEWALGVWTTLDRGVRLWQGRRGPQIHVTTTISPVVRWPVDIFDYGVDSLPMLLHSLRSLADSPDLGIAERARALAQEHASWIAGEVEHFVDRVVDPATGLVRSDRHFSAHRDTFRNGSTAYANAMVALLGRTVAETGWGPDLLSRHFVFPDSGAQTTSPPRIPVAGIRRDTAHILRRAIAGGTVGSQPEFGHANVQLEPRERMEGSEPAAERSEPAAERSEPAAEGSEPAARAEPSGSLHPDWGGLLRRHFWMGDRFRDRLGVDETSGEANVWPFHLGLIDDDRMLAAALETLRREGYTTPYPLRFDVAHRSDGQLWAFRVWSADYQTTTAWTSLGSIYLALLRRIDPAAARLELDRMRALVERDGTFWEVIDGSGRPWRSKSRLSVSDVSMLWGAILLEAFERDRGSR